MWSAGPLLGSRPVGWLHLHRITDCSDGVTKIHYQIPGKLSRTPFSLLLQSPLKEHISHSIDGGHAGAGMVQRTLYAL